jgi:hypothetical protein
MFEEDDDIVDPSALPIFKKGKEIFELIKCISGLLDDYDDEVLKSTQGFMMHDASILMVKVAGAEGADLYDLRMESAAIIRKAARDLFVHVHTLKTFGFKETHYYDLVRVAIEEYRLLFIDWVASFDKWNYLIDRWGLFNPPGIGPFDKDPDDDIPHDPNSN